MIFVDEKIYTIPVNMAFEKKEGCPFCALFFELEFSELDLILGASMMEPDVRIQTNNEGFCRRHFAKMFTMKNRLGMGLMLESHLEYIKKDISAKPTILPGDSGVRAAEHIDKLMGSCYVCKRIEDKISKMFVTAVYLWEREKQFRKYLLDTPYICLEHYRTFLRVASRHLPKKLYHDFLSDINSVQTAYFEKLREDVSWFCKKFDYRYDDEPWGDSKDAIERAISFLCSDEWKSIK